VLPAAAPVPTRPAPVRQGRLARLAPWAVFGLVAIVVLAATSMWSASLRGPEEAAALHVPVQPPPPPRPVGPGPAAAQLAAPLEDPEEDAAPTVLRGTPPPAGPEPEPVPAVPDVPAAPPPPPPPPVEEPENLIPGPDRPRSGLDPESGPESGPDVTDLIEEDDRQPECRDVLPVVPPTCETSDGPDEDEPERSTGIEE
jgi:hypothetical protein